MTRSILTITWLTFHEARRRRMVLAAVGLGAAFLTLFTVGIWLIKAELVERGAPALVEAQFHNLITLAGLYVVHFLTVMLAIFATVDTVSGEIASHTIQTIVTRPLRRWHVIIGKWIGHALMLSSYVLLLSGGVLIGLSLVLGYTPPNAIAGVGLLILEALVLLSLSLLGGTRLSTLTNGVVVFMLYGLAFIGAWVEQVGALVQSPSAIRVGIITSLLMPVEALWRRTAYLLQPPLGQGMPTPFSAASVPSAAMVVYAAVYALIALALAVRAFGRRDL
jgi:Cu-processing system permease protein